MKVEHTRFSRNGWFIVISCGVIMMCGSAPTVMFSILFRNVFEDEDTLSQQSNGVFSVYIMMQLIIGFFIRPFLKTQGARNIVLFGALLFLSGNIIAIFASGYTWLLLSYGIMAGTGFGIAAFMAYIKIVSYFQHLQTVATGIAHVIHMTGSMLHPLLIQHFIETSGRKTAQLISAGVGMHMIAAAFLLNNDRGIIKIHTGGKYSEVADFDKAIKHNFPGCQNEEESFINKFLIRIHNLFNSDNVKIVFSYSFLNIVLGITTTLCSESIYFNMLPIFLLEHRRFSLHQTTTVMIVTSSGDLGGRALTAVFGKLIHTRNRICFFISMILTSIAIFGTIVAVSFTSITIFAFFLGLFRGVMYVTSTCLFVDIYGSKVFPVVYGVNLLLHAINFCILGPLLGIFRDYTQSYAFTFLMIVAMMVVCWVLWLAEILVSILCSKKHDIDKNVTELK